MAGCWCEVPGCGCSHRCRLARRPWWQRELLRIAVMWLMVVQTPDKSPRRQDSRSRILALAAGHPPVSLPGPRTGALRHGGWSMLPCPLFPLLHSIGRSCCTIKYLSPIFLWLYIFILWLRCNKFIPSLIFLPFQYHSRKTKL